MSIDTSTSDIFGEIQASWDLTDIAWPNVRYDPSTTPYIVVNVVEVEGTLAGMTGSTGKYAIRSRGDVVGSLFLKANVDPSQQSGDLEGMTGVAIAAAFKKILSNQSIGSTVLFTGRVVDAGLSDDGSWYRYNIIIPYQCNVLEDQ